MSSALVVDLAALLVEVKRHERELGLLLDALRRARVQLAQAPLAAVAVAQVDGRDAAVAAGEGGDVLGERAEARGMVVGDDGRGLVARVGHLQQGRA